MFPLRRPHRLQYLDQRLKATYQRRRHFGGDLIDCQQLLEFQETPDAMRDGVCQLSQLGTRRSTLTGVGPLQRIDSRMLQREIDAS